MENLCLFSTKVASSRGKVADGSVLLHNGLFRNFVKGTKESAAHSGGLSKSRKSGELPPCGLAALPTNLSCFRFI